MVERDKTRGEFHQERQAFITEAIQEGAHEKQPERISESGWEKAINIGAAFYFGNEPLEVLGKQYELSRAGASLNARKFIKGLWGNSSHELQFLYPLKDLLSKRPESEINRQRRSQAHGGISFGVKEQILSGITSIEEIKRNTGFSIDSIKESLRILRKWGIDTRHLYQGFENQEKIEQLKKEEDDKKIQQILDELPTSLILRNLVKKKLKNKIKRDGIFITVGDLTSGVFHYKSTETGLFFDSLRLSGIPSRRAEYQIAKTGRVPAYYYVLLERHRERALGVLKEDTRLKRYKENPVKIICGQSTDPIPNTHQLKRSGNFRYIGSLLKELGIPISNGRAGLHYSDFLTSECPVPVYQYQRRYSKSYCFPIEYADALKKFLRNRYQNLRKSKTS